MGKFFKSAVLLSAVGLTACGAGNIDLQTSSSGAKTAPAMAVVPQASYNQNGQVNVERFQAVQSSYSQQGAKQVSTSN